jgi:hypothetical protein
MEFTRTHYLVVGLLLLFLGIQARVIDSYVLNEPTTRFLAERFGPKPEGVGNGLVKLVASDAPLPRKSIRPPDWLGYALMSVGLVLAMQGAAMKRPDAK